MISEHDHTLWYDMLGPIVVRQRKSLGLGPRQRRPLLTRLVVEGGRPVPHAGLCHSLWGDDQPTASVSSVRAHTGRLRSVLDPDRKGRSSVLAGQTSGYALSVPPEARDSTAFDGHVVRSRDALARERLPLARAEIDTALGLWRGPALGEAAEEPFALREGARLNAARQDAGELLAAILIAQGDLVPAVSVAEQLTVGTPLREVSWSLLMRALYAAGRPVEALRQYDRFRTTLARELGLGPSLPPPQRARPVARVPDAVRRIVQARLARLPAPARTMLTYAMADGGRLDMGLLADVQCLTHEQLLRPVEDSVVGRLVARHEDPDALGGGHHRLSDLVHDVLLRALTTSSRQLLHSAIARALTGRGDADPGRPDDQLRAADPMAPAAAFGQSGRSLLDPEP